MNQSHQVFGSFGLTASVNASGNAMAGIGSTSVSGNAVGGGGGTVQASVSGGGSGQWVFTRAIVIQPPASTPPPPGVTFPYGLVDFELALGQAGSAATVVLSYPNPLPPGTVYWKFGRTTDNPTPHWYIYSNATISGNTVTLYLTDGQNGDNDLSVNSIISDHSGAGYGGLDETAIPTLNPTMLALLAGLLGISTYWLRRRGR
jgi:hypothetical protein